MKISKINSLNEDLLHRIIDNYGFHGCFNYHDYTHGEISNSYLNDSASAEFIGQLVLAGFDIEYQGDR